jgi:hypothetical protein
MVNECLFDSVIVRNYIRLKVFDPNDRAKFPQLSPGKKWLRQLSGLLSE